MLVRINGGNSGIGKYLEEGRKSDRYFSRDELDKRVTLHGNLNLTEAIIENINDKGQERYYHITLSFREDEIEPEQLERISNEYVQTLLKAYNAEEYNYYAEAHLPKIKQILDRKNNVLIDRKPHIHIVIPKVNLVTGKHFSPLGLIEKSNKELDSIQEYINQKYKLQSPKEFIRIKEPEVYAAILSRIKGDTYREKQGKVKVSLIGKIESGQINTIAEFEKELAAVAEDTKIRNKGKDSQYYAIKIKGDKKYTNLKSPIFHKAFIENKALPNLQPSSKEIEISVKKWIDITSKENKYINTASAKLKEQYRAIKNNEEKVAFLVNLEKNYNKKYGLLIEEPAQEQPFVATQATNKLIKPNLVIKQSSYVYELLMQKKSLVRAIKADNEALDANTILNKLENTHFINKAKYAVVGDKIVFQDKHYRPLELLSEHIHLNTIEIEKFLESQHQKSADNQIQHYKKAEKRMQMFENMLKYSNKDLFASYKSLFSQSHKTFKDDIENLVNKFQDKSQRKDLDFNQEITVLIFEKLKREEYINDFRKIIIQNQQEIKTFLQNKAYTTEPKGAMNMQEPIATEENYIAGKDFEQTDFIQQTEVQQRYAAWYYQNRENLKKADLVIEKGSKGQVNYYDKNEPKKPLFVDNGTRLVMKSKEMTPVQIKIMLDLAQAKYGGILEINGSKEFKEKCIEVIARENLNILPKNKALLKQLQERKQLIQMQEQQQNTNNIQTNKEQKSEQSKEPEKQPKIEEPQDEVKDEFQELIEYGNAPYLFDPKNKESFYIKLRDKSGQEQVLFGVGLVEAIKEADAKVGDMVKAVKGEREAVKVKEEIKDERGNTINIIEKDAYRNSWIIEKDLTIEKSQALEDMSALEGKKITETQIANKCLTVPNYANDLVDAYKQEYAKESRVEKSAEEYAKHQVVSKYFAEIQNQDKDLKGFESTEEFSKYCNNKVLAKEAKEVEQMKSEEKLVTLDRVGGDVTVEFKLNGKKEMECIVKGETMSRLSVAERKPYIDEIFKDPRIKEVLNDRHKEELIKSGVVQNAATVMVEFSQQVEEKIETEQDDLEL